MEAHQETDRSDEQSANSELGESVSFAYNSHGTDVDVWSAGSRSGRVGALCLYLHHHGGLPRCVDLPHLYCLPERNEGCLCQAMEDKG